MLYRLASISIAYAEVLESLVRSGPTRLVFSWDELKPGNMLRPDKGRSATAVYLAFAEMPKHIRSSTHGWLTVLMLPPKVLGLVLGGLSKVIEIFVEHLFGTNFNFLRPGILLPFGTSDRPYFRFRAKIGILVADEKAIKELCGTKGASGSKPCCHCVNVVGSSDYLVHFSNENFLRFDQLSFQRFDAMVGRLRAMHGEMSRRDFARLQQDLGLSHSPHGGVTYGPVRLLLRIPESVCYHPMHILYASGGWCSTFSASSSCPSSCSPTSP
jgi:hypothetical protein